MTREFILGKMTWPEVEERLKETQIAIIPLGSTEEHGHHMPIGCDYRCAEAFASLVAKEVADDVGAIVLPVMPYGVTCVMDWPGTITLRSETSINLYIDIMESLIHHGFNKLVMLNGHGGNVIQLQVAMKQVKLKTNAWIGMVGIESFLPEGFRESIYETRPLNDDSHAGEAETSTALALGLDIRMDKRITSFPKYEGPAGYVKHAPAPVGHALYGLFLPLRESMHTGIMGDPTKASKEKGEKIINKAVEGFADFLRKLNELEVNPFPFNIWNSRR